MLAAGAGAERAIITGNPGNAMVVKDDMPAIIAIVTGSALLAPVLLRPVAGTAAMLLARAGAGSMVVSQNVLWAGRRTAATAAPVVLALGLAISMLAVEATAGRASRLPGGQPVSPHDQAQNGQATAVILGIALTYCILAIANTMVIAASARKREIAALSLAGATRRQALGMVTAESALTAAIAAVTATAAGAAVIACQHAALARLFPDPPISVPWLRIGEIAAACLTAAVTASALSAAKALRERLTDPIRRLCIRHSNCQVARLARSPVPAGQAAHNTKWCRQARYRWSRAPLRPGRARQPGRAALRPVPRPQPQWTSASR
jgi:hypothetical protein